MTPQQATAEVFLTALKSLSKQEQESILTRIALDKKLHQLLEDISDRLAVEEGRDERSRPLRDYIAERERTVDILRVAHRREVYREES